jgi:hypothetical protein
MNLFQTANSNFKLSELTETSRISLPKVARKFTMTKSRDRKVQLEKRRIFADLKLLTRSLNNQIDTQTFIPNINLTVPQRSTRSCLQFTTHTSRSDTGKYSVFNRMMTSFNVYGEGCDLFFDDISTLLTKLKSNLNSLYEPTF